MKGLHMTAFILLVIGGLNWLVYALFSWDVGMIFGDANNMVARIIYVLVGLAALHQIFTHKSYCKYCEGMGKAKMDKPTMPAGGDKM